MSALCVVSLMYDTRFIYLFLKFDCSAPDQSYQGGETGGQRVLENWNRDRLSLHASRRTSQGFNFALHDHASPHPCRWIGPKFNRHRPQLRRTRPSSAPQPVAAKPAGRFN